MELLHNGLFRLVDGPYKFAVDCGVARNRNFLYFFAAMTVYCRLQQICSLVCTRLKIISIIAKARPDLEKTLLEGGRITVQMVSPV